MVEEPTQEELNEAFEEGKDQVGFSMQPHPITGQPQFVLHARSKTGDKADVRMDVNEAVNLGSQITAQATAFIAISNFAQMAAAQQQGIIRP